MKSAYAVALCVLLLFSVSCAQKVNDPADVKAIEGLLEGYSKADMSNDAAFFNSTYYKDGAVRMPPNGAIISGKEGIVKAFEENWAKYTTKNFELPVDAVLSSGDLAVARGRGTGIDIPKASGLPSDSNPAKWVGVYQRQSDGSWKCAFDIWNSDAPALGATADGAEEQALYQLERDWAEANVKRDIAAVEKFLAKDFVSNYNGKMMNKAQTLAAIKNNPAKVESAENSDMTAMVFGDTAVIRGIYSEKSTTRGKDTSMKGRYTEIYAKRDGRWQCVAQYATMMQ